MNSKPMTEGKKAILEATKRAMIKFPDKWEARTKLREAVRKGIIIKPEICDYLVKSDLICEGRIEAYHHLGYEGENWKNVLWLCQKHRYKIHKARGIRAHARIPKGIRELAGK